MSRTPIETLKAYFASFRDADWREQIPELFHPDIVYLNFASEEISPETKQALPWAGTWRGHDGVIAFQEMLNDNFDIRGFEDPDYFENGDEVAVFGVLRFTAAPTARDVDSDFAVRATVRDGRISRYHFYEDTFAIAHAFRRDGQWKVENGEQGAPPRFVPSSRNNGGEV
ncbi:nuclear transport factor 2 family protein [uncultured Roseobacter sp.]|uniref:nuclear transport factor 2 family protein n=1 Tax=uncultured Roseobacter sp. TaxID=114847 RepID=UPI002612662B|nr:nuclear transport factor 2 family protein [uncultured Roseobacter sp.]